MKEKREGLYYMSDVLDKAVLEKAKIRRSHWDEGVYVYYTNSFLKPGGPSFIMYESALFIVKGCSVATWLPNLEELLAGNWEVLDEPM